MIWNKCKEQLMIIFQTKIDFTLCRGVLAVVFLVFFMFGLGIAILPLFGVNIEILHLVYSAIGVLLFSVYLIYDTQVVDNQQSSQFSDDDGWQPQVLDLPRGVHLCRHRHLPRHPQPLPSHSQTCCRCKEMIDFVSMYLIQLSNNNLSH